MVLTLFLSCALGAGGDTSKSDHRMKLADLAAKFDEMDQNHDGSISRHELIDVGHQGGHFDEGECEDHADTYLNIYDTDQDGHVTMDEFVHALGTAGKDGLKALEDRASQLDEARSLFREIDQDKDGDISRQELIENMYASLDASNYPEDHLHEMHLREKDDEADSWFDTYDVDGDGKVTMHEIIHKDALQRKEQEALETAAAAKQRETDRMHRH